MINNVKKERQKRNLTQEDLAKHMKVSRQSINAIETGRYLPSILLALKLSEFFKLSVNELFVIEGADY